MKSEKQLLFVPLVGKTSACRQKEGLKLIKDLPLLPRLTAVLPPQGREISKGFTLIELLVVVLIIGILAAVALPQYQLAVEKSRFATLKNLTKSILEAQEIYYMEHGSYASYFKDLIIDMPGDKLETSTLKDYVYDWGSCMLNTRESDVYVVCTNDKMRLQAYPAHAPAHPNDIACMSKGSAADSVHAKICKQETGRADNGGENGGYRYWFYE